MQDALPSSIAASQGRSAALSSVRDTRPRSPLALPGASATRLGRAGTWAFWRNLALCFCVFSVVGHWLEIGYCTLVRLGLLPGTYDPASQVWAGWLDPFCVYGFGAVACVLLLRPLKARLQRRLPGGVAPLAASFVVNMLVCVGIEFANGLLFNQPLADGSLPLWDYRDLPCNFQGQVCLQTALAFGIVSTFMTWVVCPCLETLFARVPRRALDAAFAAVVAWFSLLLAL